MILIKSFLASLLLYASPDTEEGWVAVEPVNRSEMVGMSDTVDPSIWVVFAKELGEEKFLISFPEEPTYRYLDGRADLMEVRAAFDGMEYRMQVFDQFFDSAEELSHYLVDVPREGRVLSVKEIADPRGIKVRLAYWKDGFWYFEEALSTQYRTYYFQTKSADMEPELHQKFVDSFDLENRR